VQPPDIEIPVWRFLSLAKFLDLLETGTLHFARMDQFDDPYEGQPFGCYLNKIRYRTDLLATLAAMRRRSRATFYVNSWYLADHEPAWAWKQFLGGDLVVAVCSKYLDLMAAIESSQERCFLGLVQYAEPAEGRGLNAFDFAMAKRPNFDHEKEVRALLWREAGLPIDEVERDNPTGIKVSVDLNLLLDSVIVSPTAPPWLRKTLEAVMSKLGVNQVPVIPSPLYDTPELAAYGGLFVNHNPLKGPSQ
jgi:hypothetical protein